MNLVKNFEGAANRVFAEALAAAYLEGMEEAAGMLDVMALTKWSTPKFSKERFAAKHGALCIRKEIYDSRVDSKMEDSSDRS